MPTLFRPFAVLGFVIVLGLGVGACSLQLPGGYAEEPHFADDYPAAP